ncbi:phosphotransferase family protein [Aspergillus undulatus]|uniref:phosphotransferase family protein n=1 Tax=Aspergillus undulatus TaxID=1810928 RepID=UPI003CCC9F19
MAGPVRQPIDVPSLEDYIRTNGPEIKTPLGVKQFGFGQSNPTYLLTPPILKPRGTLLFKTAHQVEREYCILHALRDTDVPVPKVYVLCEDESVIGTAFYIMGFFYGRVFTDPGMPGKDMLTIRFHGERWRSAIQILITLHTLSCASLGLSNLGRESGFYARQIKTFTTISRHQATTVNVHSKKPIGPLPHPEEMASFFAYPANQPGDQTSIVHGDYKIDNLIFHKTEPRVIGVLDWEMATLGHRLSNVVSLIAPVLPHVWSSPVSDSTNALSSHTQDASTLGIPTLEECLSLYATSGYYARRQASSSSAREFGPMAWPAAEGGWGLVRELRV